MSTKVYIESLYFIQFKRGDATLKKKLELKVASNRFRVTLES
jgi:hypothetical protein